MTKLFQSALWIPLFFASAVSFAAEGVYVTQGPNGPTFSNVPQPGSKELDLRPLTVIQSPKNENRPPARPAPTRENAENSDPRGGSRKDTQESMYQNFSVTWPQDSGSVVINSGTFDVRLAIDPALRLEEGHSFTVSVNGLPVRERFTATEFTIPPEFFGDSIPVNQFASLEASVVDRSGVVLKKAEPIRFFMRFTTVLQNPNARPNPSYPFLQPPPAAPTHPRHRQEGQGREYRGNANPHSPDSSNKGTASSTSAPPPRPAAPQGMGGRY